MLCLLGLLCFKLFTCRSHSCSCIRPCTWRWLRLHSCGSCTTPAELWWPVLHGYSKDVIPHLDGGTMQSETPCLSVCLCPLVCPAWQTYLPILAAAMRLCPLENQRQLHSSLFYDCPWLLCRCLLLLLLLLVTDLLLNDHWQL